ncbi:DUF885 domain-containing protein [Brevibacterium sp. S22]|nr:DUF885 domain-containing protein [Brevibacterium sp. S22]
MSRERSRETVLSANDEERPTVLDELGAEYHELFATWSPINATSFGIPGHDHQVPDLAPTAQREVVRRMVRIRETVAGISQEGLREGDRSTRSALLYATQAVIDTIESRVIDWAIGGVGAGPIYSVLALVGKAAGGTEAQAAAYLERCTRLPRYLDQSAQRLLEGAESGFVANRQELVSAIAQIEGYLASSSTSDPLLEILPQIPGVDVRSEVEAVVNSRVRPAMRRLLAVVREDLLPVARSDDKCGMIHLPGGGELYARAVSTHTTADFTPEELHRIGLNQRDELCDELCEIAQSELGISGFENVRERMRTARALRYRDSDEILHGVRSALRRAEQVVPLWFNVEHIARCEVLELNDEEARFAPIGQYRPPDGSRPGQYWVNASEPMTRSRYEYEAVSFHEGVPGHHLQLAISQDLSALSEFRRYLYVTAHGEGWGLYAERLADEMGLYSSDLARMGMVALDLWRAARLVVDTGIHAFGWTRNQAIEYMQDNTVLNSPEIVSEVDRYIGWPGQALAYMVGRLEIARLRTHAEAALSDRFDISRFHELVLGGGSLPLHEVADVVQRWILRTERH